jgi:hypothetical protein
MMQMSGQKLTRELITEWAYGRATIELSESDCDGDAASFDNAVVNIFEAKGLLEFAADPDCSCREYFVGKLVTLFLWVFRSSGELPFHFSRFLGIKSREDYMREVESQAKEVYEVCLVLDSMRFIKEPAIQSLYKQLLDFRYDHAESNRDFYYRCWAALNLELFSVKIAG